MLNAVMYGATIGLGLGIAGGSINIISRTLFGTGWVSWAMSMNPMANGGQ